MAEERHLRLSDIVAMTNAPALDLMEMLPPPSQVFIGDDAVCVWESSEVRAALDEAEKLGLLPPNTSARRGAAETYTVPDLRQERNNLRREIGALADELERHKETLRTLRIQVRAAENYLHDHDVERYREALDISMKQGTRACWPWQPPMSAPERAQGVYRLIKKGRTVYIGQSVHVMGRVADHAKSKDFDQFSYARVDGDPKVLNEVESALIIVERPVGNHGFDGRLRHPVGHEWTREEAQAVLDKYQRCATADAEESAA